MILSIHLSRLNAGEFLRFIKDIIKICSGFAKIKANYDKHLKLLNDCADTLDDVYKKSTASKYSDKIAEFDHNRDEGIKCLTYLSKGYARHHDPKIKAAGEAILNAIFKYGKKIYNLSYEEETTVLENLIEDLTKIETYKLSVDLLKLDDVVKNIEDNNEKLNNTILERDRETAQLPEDSFTDIRSDCSKKYKKLTEFINALQITDDKNSYVDLINEINAVIERYSKFTHDTNQDESDDDE